MWNILLWPVHHPSLLLYHSYTPSPGHPLPNPFCCHSVRQIVFSKIYKWKSKIRQFIVFQWHSFKSFSRQGDSPKFSQIVPLPQPYKQLSLHPNTGMPLNDASSQGGGYAWDNGSFLGPCITFIKSIYLQKFILNLSVFIHRYNAPK